MRGDHDKPQSACHETLFRYNRLRSEEYPEQAMHCGPNTLYWNIMLSVQQSAEEKKYVKGNSFDSVEISPFERSSGE